MYIMYSRVQGPEHHQVDTVAWSCVCEVCCTQLECRVTYQLLRGSRCSPVSGSGWQVSWECHPTRQGELCELLMSGKIYRGERSCLWCLICTFQTGHWVLHTHTPHTQVHGDRCHALKTEHTASKVLWCTQICNLAFYWLHPWLNMVHHKLPTISHGWQYLNHHPTAPQLSKGDTLTSSFRTSNTAWMLSWAKTRVWRHSRWPSLPAKCAATQDPASAAWN